MGKHDVRAKGRKKPEAVRNHGAHSAEQKHFNPLDWVSGLDFSAAKRFLGTVLEKMRPQNSEVHREYELNMNTAGSIAGAALALLVLAMLPTKGAVRAVLFLLPLLLVGYETLTDAYVELFAGDFFGRNVLISLSAIVCFCLGRFREATVLLLLFRIGVMIEALARTKRDELKQRLYAYASARCMVETDNAPEERDAALVSPGDVLIVEAGEQIALDGIVLEGQSDLDLSRYTAEEETRHVEVGSSVASGAVNLTEKLRVQVTQGFENSTANRYIHLADQAAEKPGAAYGFQTFVSMLQPVLAVLGLILAFIVPIFTGSWRTGIYRGMLLLAIASVSSVAFTVTLAYACGVYRSALRGTLFKSGSAMDRLAGAATMIFSKTGTLMEPAYTVEDVCPVELTPDKLLLIAALAEGDSTHPIANALRQASKIGLTHSKDVEILDEVAGRGVSALFGTKHIYVGNAAMMEEHGISFEVPNQKGLILYVAIDSEYAGYIVLQDHQRENAFDILEELRVLGIKSMVMLTGDLRSNARPIASSLNFDMVKCEMSLEEKAAAIDYLEESKGGSAAIAYVVHQEEELELLSHADLGIAFDALYLIKAMEKADVLLMGDNIARLSASMRAARRSVSAAWINLAGLLCVKLLLLILGLCGVMSAWGAVLLESLALAACVFNCFYQEK